MKGSLLALLLVIALLLGCNEPGSKKENVAVPKTSATSGPAGQAQSLIVRYNQLLSEGYRIINMTKLQEVATQELAEKAYYHMAAISEGKTRMVSDLKKIDFVETDCSQPKRCRVVTKEKWDFAYADIQTGKRSNEVKDYLYDVQYLVENREGRWVITEISASGEERKDVPSWKEMFQKK